eukprot:334121-Prorocentrum_minimum.AAC.1
MSIQPPSSLGLEPCRPPLLLGSPSSARLSAEGADATGGGGVDATQEDMIRQAMEAENNAARRELYSRDGSDRRLSSREGRLSVGLSGAGS